MDAAFVKATTNLLAAQGWLALLVHWPLYGAVITGVLGTFLLQASLHVGPLAASQSAVLIVGYSFGYFSSKDLFRLGFCMSIIDSVLLLLVVPFYWPLLGITS